APPPPPTLAPNSFAFLTATVLNDPVGNGVDWSVSCGTPGNCGSFFPVQSPVGSGPTTYSAPSGVPVGSTVTVTASSTTDPSMSDSVSITISAANPSSFLSGSYTFALSGINSRGRICIAGVLHADGMGTITGGEQDSYDFHAGYLQNSFTG